MYKWLWADLLSFLADLIMFVAVSFYREDIARRNAMTLDESAFRAKGCRNHALASGRVSFEENANSSRELVHLNGTRHSGMVDIRVNVNICMYENLGKGHYFRPH